jgi:hypothetical protein
VSRGSRPGVRAAAVQLTTQVPGNQRPRQCFQADRLLHLTGLLSGIDPAGSLSSAAEVDAWLQRRTRSRALTELADAARQVSDPAPSNIALAIMTDIGPETAAPHIRQLTGDRAARSAEPGAWSCRMRPEVPANCHVFAGHGCWVSVRESGARISGALTFRQAQLSADPGRAALAADGCTVEGTVDLTQLRARGEISMRTGRVGQRILLRDARLDNPGGIALRLSGTEVAADVHGQEMTVRGGLRLAGTRVGSHLRLDQVRLDCPAGTALDARALQAAEVSLVPAEPIQGLVNFTHAHVGILRDHPGFWPERLSLDGLTYQILEPGLPARRRLTWLGRDPARHQPQPYEQLAAMYTSTGQPGEARHVLYIRERSQHDASQTLLGRAWSRLQDVTVGYGYKPWRAVVCLAVLWVAGSIVYAAAPPLPLLRSTAPHFNPIIYTLNC